jgi:hypothetical protein
MAKSIPKLKDVSMTGSTGYEGVFWQDYSGIAHANFARRCRICMYDIGSRHKTLDMRLEAQDLRRKKVAQVFLPVIRSSVKHKLSCISFQQSEQQS